MELTFDSCKKTSDTQISFSLESLLICEDEARALTESKADERKLAGHLFNGTRDGTDKRT